MQNAFYMQYESYLVNIITFAKQSFEIYSNVIDEYK